MRVAITDGKGRLWIDEAPMPEPTDYQCLCRIEACASCSGTDQKHIHGTLPFPNNYPGVLGHESVGTVLEAGRRVKNYRVGDRVFRPAAVFPGERLGAFFSVWGGFAEYGLVQDTSAMIEDGLEKQVNPYGQFQQRIPEDLSISSTDATMMITLKETSSFMANTGIRMGASVVILGVGAVGLCMSRCAKLMGVGHLIVGDCRQDALDRALAIGADAAVNGATENMVERIMSLTDGRGAHRIIDTTGNAQLLQEAQAALSADGKLVPYAMYASMDTPEKILDGERTLSAVLEENLAHDYIIGMVRLKMLDPKAFYSHRLPLENIVEGFDLLRTREAFKIVCEMNHD